MDLGGWILGDLVWMLGILVESWRILGGSCVDLGWILDGFWMDLGWILG